MQPAVGVAEVNGTRLAYEVAGAGPPLVLVHGFSLDRRMWAAQVEDFSARYRVICYDARGFGRSGAATAAPYRHVDDLRALLDHLAVERVHLCGLSMGGGIALDFTLTYPERTRTLTVVDAAINGWRWSETWETEIRPVWEAGRRGDSATARDRWLAQPLFAPANERPAVATALATIVGDYSGWHWLDQPHGHASPEPPAAQRLTQIAMPTLIVVGERDLPDFHACAAAMHQQIPDARLVTVPGAGHMTPMEEPAAFNRAVLAFLDEQPA